MCTRRYAAKRVLVVLPALRETVYARAWYCKAFTPRVLYQVHEAKRQSFSCSLTRIPGPQTHMSVKDLLGCSCLRSQRAAGAGTILKWKQAVRQRPVEASGL
ncbi:hypothetical protein NDU88_002333 [Pleurodeles waltl]|uniref:Secreted protein n=1 Tax=Pleurodeles waltl TaxID=8319 RepID=A0AAV7W3R5_PLEWA|nr:hypothetical protein NDU88_002333 [Pleurodeles waltl]